MSTPETTTTPVKPDRQWDAAEHAPEAANARIGPDPTTGQLVNVTVTPTQIRRPWRSTVRTAFQALTGLAPMAPVIYQAATDHDPTLASGAAGVALAISAGVTRVMAIPGVETWLRRFVPFLAAAPRR